MAETIDESDHRRRARHERRSRRAARLSREASSFSGAISRAFKDAIVGGKSFESVLKDLALRLAGLALNAALAPLSNAIGGASPRCSAPSAWRTAASRAAVRRFARGGVVDGPTLFPLAGGLGLMGEAGPEAVLPLARGSDGRLGVAVAGAGRSSSTSTSPRPTPPASPRSEAQVTAMLARAVAAAGGGCRPCRR